MAASAHKGLLVAVEGIDGAGKTTQITRLGARLRQAGVPFVTTKEPTSGPWGAKIRASAVHGRMSAEEELEAFIEDRRQHVAEVIEPALVRGEVVLVDRYYLSTVAYQGARGFDPGRLLEANAFAPAPDLLIVLDVDPAVGLQRIRQRGDSADLFEKEEELGKAREIFRTLGVANLHVLDGALPPDALTERIAGLLFARLGMAASKAR